MPTPAGEFAGDGPEGPGDGEVVGGGDAQRDERRQGRPEAHEIALPEIGENGHVKLLMTRDCKRRTGLGKGFRLGGRVAAVTPKPAQP